MGGALYFLAGQLAATSAKIISDRAATIKSSGAVTVYASLKRQMADAAGYQAAMDQILPTQDGLIKFNQWIASIASKYQITANASFHGGEPSATSMGQIGQEGFTLSANGTLNNLVAFLQDIQSKSPGFLLNITSFNLAKQGGSYQFEGQGQLFFR